MTRTLIPRPLTAEAFAPYGEVIEAAAAARQAIPINYGATMRFHDLARIDVAEGGGEPCVSIFRSQPLPQPIEIKLMERHPLGSQAFIPFGGRPYLVVVAPPGELDPDRIEAFLAQPHQGVNYAKGTWHHYSLALEGESDFLVIDRQGPGDNLDEVELAPEQRWTIAL
ncbi:MAG: ureidoglycolate lyase [Proteobacteria bacterium]|nr:ureidoglycolate lyase [Pseudomonadota bacterium]